VDKPGADPSTSHPSAFEGGQPPDVDGGADVLFPDAMRPRAYEQASVADPDDAEDERRD